MPGFELIDNKEKEALNSLFDEGGVLFAHGFDGIRKRYHVREFESELSSYFSSNHSLCVSSGTAAIKCALAAYDIKAGDEVITQSFNFIATLEAIHDIGATAVVVGIDDSLNMCPKHLKENITEKTKAIMPVHMLGVPADMSSIMDIASIHNIPVIEDACEAVGAKYDNKFAGTLCDYGIFSFDFGKNITTGEGGAILSKSHDLDTLVREYHDHGHQNIENLPRGLDLASRPGFNYRLGEMNAVVGKEQLKKLDFILNENKKRYMVLSDGLANISSIKKRYIPNLAVPSYDTFIFEISDEDKREEVKNILISSGIGTKNLPDAIRWHCSYYWNYFLEDANNKYATETLQKLSKNIAIPIVLKKDIHEYKNILKEILNVFV
tara:strand:+ start:157 stop:1296 length:1140 start_codon:yes stop_codon:yes gene_type:complete